MAAKKAGSRARANRKTATRRPVAKKRVTKKRTKSKPVTPKEPEPKPKPEPTGPVYLNEGQRRICELPASSTEIARAIGVSPPMVRQIRAGTKSPGPDVQRRIEAALGIPVRAWGVRPGAEISSSPLAATGGVSGQSLQDVELALNVCRDVLQNTSSTTKEKLDAAARMNQLSATHRQITGDNRTAIQKLVQSPEWTRFKKLLADALVKHPEAAKDVEELLREWDSEE